jgi:hypothetical protein
MVWALPIPYKPVFYAEHRRPTPYSKEYGVAKGLIKPILRLVFYAEHRRLGVHIRLGLMPGGPFLKDGGAINFSCCFKARLIKPSLRGGVIGGNKQIPAPPLFKVHLVIID